MGHYVSVIAVIARQVVFLPDEVQIVENVLKCVDYHILSKVLMAQYTNIINIFYHYATSIA